MTLTDWSWLSKEGCFSMLFTLMFVIYDRFLQVFRCLIKDLRAVLIFEWVWCNTGCLHEGAALHCSLVPAETPPPVTLFLPSVRKRLLMRCESLLMIMDPVTITQSGKWGLRKEGGGKDFILQLFWCDMVIIHGQNLQLTRADMAVGQIIILIIYNKLIVFVLLLYCFIWWMLHVVYVSAALPLPLTFTATSCCYLW